MASSVSVHRDQPVRSARGPSDPLPVRRLRLNGLRVSTAGGGGKATVKYHTPGVPAGLQRPLLLIFSALPGNPGASNQGQLAILAATHLSQSRAQAELSSQRGTFTGL